MSIQLTTSVVFFDRFFDLSFVREVFLQQCKWTIAELENSLTAAAFNNLKRHYALFSVFKRFAHRNGSKTYYNPNIYFSS